LTYKYVLPQALQLAAMARKPELFLRDILLLFGIGTPNKFHLTDYYEIDRHGIHAKPLSEDEERKLQDSGGLYCTWDEIIRLHRLDFPCTPSQLIDWCNRYDPFGMEWEALLPEVFVKVVKASMVDNEDKSCYTKESPKTAPSMANGAETNKSLASAEKNCKAWLIGLMGGDSTPDKTKAVYQKEAQEKYKKLSARAFVRAWGGAIADTGNAKWSNPGRKPIQS